jgi:hypothetical protein
LFDALEWIARESKASIFLMGPNEHRTEND